TPPRFINGNGSNVLWRKGIVSNLFAWLQAASDFSEGPASARYLFSEVFDLKPTRTHCISRVSAGKTATCPEGTLDISRWCKPPVRRERLIQAPGGAAEIARYHSVAPAGARRISWSEPVVCTTG